MFSPLILAAFVGAGSGDLPFRGTVEAEGAGPVAGATILLTAATTTGGPSVVVARGTTDERGRYALERPETVGDYPRPRLWVAAPGYNIASIGYRGPMPEADESVNVTLNPPGKAEIRVRKPDGSPAVGTRVHVSRTSYSELAEIPEELQELASAVTDAEGRATIDAFSPREVMTVVAEAEGYGIQPRDESPPTPGPRTIVLRPVGRLEGRLVAEGRVDFRGWRIKASTRPAEPGPQTGPIGRASVEVGPDGRYSIPEIAAGRLSFWIDWPDESPVLPDFADHLPAVAAGQANVADIPLRPATTVVGTVREREGGAPVEGVKLFFNRPGETSSTAILTDAEGRFTVRSLDGKARLSVAIVPKTHVNIPRIQLDNIEVPRIPDRFELDPIAIRRAAPPLRGIVRDEGDRPVPNASVAYVWSERNEAGYHQVNASATADAAGAFALGGIAPGVEVAVTARRKDRITAGPVAAKAGQAEELTLRIAPSGTVAVAGRVLAAGGLPIPAAEVKLVARIVEKGQMRGSRPVYFDRGDSPLTTAADGSFRSPKELERRDAEFRAEVTAAGYEPGQSSWTGAGDGPVVMLPDIRLVRSEGPREVVGRVEGPDGRPIAGARVFQSGNRAKRSEVTADAGGDFRLTGVPGGTALVFAEAPGYRFGGMIVGDDGANVILRLDREGDPAPARVEGRPSLPRAEERAIARDLLAPLLPQARAGTLEHIGDRVIPALARVDPDRVLAMLEDRALSNPGAALIQAALGRFEDDPAAAVKIIEANRNPASRAGGLLALAALIPRSEPDRFREFLERALAEARRDDGKDSRLDLLGRVADGFLALGQSDRAKAVIAEGRDWMAASPKDAFSFRGEEFGEILGVIDLEAARDLFTRKGRTNASPADQSQVDRHLGRLATRLARIDPAAAEQVVRGLRSTPGYYDREEAILQTCCALAAADLPRAKGLLDALEGEAKPGQSKTRILVLKADGLGRMAEALRESDPAAARSLLDEAFAALRTTSEQSKGSPTSPAIASVMAGLLPTVAVVDPARLRERCWLAASSRSHEEPSPTPAVNVPRQKTAMQQDAAVAIAVAPHDGRLAEVVAGPIFERLPGLAVESMNLSDDTLFRAVATYDPRRVMPLLAAMPEVSRQAKKDGNGGSRVSLDTRARLAAAETLGRPPASRRHVTFGFLPSR